MWSPVGAIVFLGASLTASGLWKQGVRTPYTRKVFHFIIFSSATIIHFTAGPQATSVYGAVVFLGVLHAVARGDGYSFYEALARPTDAPKRSLHVIVPLISTALGGVASNFIAGPLAPVGYLVGGWGDAVGEPVGTRWGKHRFQVATLGGVKATRSLEGCAAVFILSFLAAFFAMGMLDQNDLFLRALTIATVAVIVESISPHGLDNFTVQAMAAWAATWTCSLTP